MILDKPLCKEDRILGIDVGGTFIKYAYMDGEAGIIEKDETATACTTLDEYLSILYGIIDKYPDIKGIGMSAPGTIDSTTGYFYTAGALNDFAGGINLQEILEEKAGVPVRIENDAKCAGLAEVASGALKGVSDAVVIVLGTGVGGCVIMDGKVHTGKNFAAGEFSFLITNENFTDQESSLAFSAGNIGLRIEAGKAMNVDPDSLDGKKIFEAANNGNEEVVEAIRRFAFHVALSIYNLQIILDPEKFAIGGGISRQPLLLDLIREQLEVIYQKKYIPVVAGKKAEVVPCAYLSDANLIGAAYHLIRNGL